MNKAIASALIALTLAQPALSEGASSPEAKSEAQPAQCEGVSTPLVKSLSAGLQARAELQYSSAEGHTPLWLNANRYGLSSLESNNGALRLTIDRPLTADSLRHWGIGYAADMAVASHFSSDVILQQLYLKLRYRKASVTIGQKEEPLNLKPQGLTTGSQALGINARPIPGIRFAFDDYVDFLNGWMGIRGHFFYGMQTDGDFQNRMETGRYIDKTIVHHKSGFLRFGRKDRPLTVEAGLEMATQFGGDIYNKVKGTVTHRDKSLKSFIKAIYGGKSDQESGNYHSAEGNMLGAWLMRVNYDRPTFSVSAYADHYFEDDSQMFLLDYDGYGKGDRWDVKESKRFLLYPLRDILLGADLQLKAFRPISHVVVEYVCSRHQAGPIYHDHSTYIPDHIGGADNYCNHGTYGSWSHWGQINGNPLYRAPLYDGNALVTTSNRFKAWHVALAGSPATALSYRLLATWQKGWGTYGNPFLYVKRNFSFLSEVDYSLSGSLRGITVRAAFALDRGELLGNNTGGQISIIWNSVLCR